MKRFTLSLIVALLAFSPSYMMAQDDMYFVPKKETKEEKAKRKAEKEAKRRAEQEAEQRAYEAMMARVYSRIYHEDVDLYNRHYGFEPGDTIEFDSLSRGDDRITFDDGSDTLYNCRDNYKFTRMMRRFENLDFALSQYDSGFYSWYDDPWYYDSWHYPYSAWGYPYSSWNWRWGYHRPYGYYGYYGWNSWHLGYYDPWYDPWYHSYGWGGYYRPWHYYGGVAVRPAVIRSNPGTRHHGSASAAASRRVPNSNRVANRSNTRNEYFQNTPSNTSRSNSSTRSYNSYNNSSNSNRSYSSGGSYNGGSRGGGGSRSGGGAGGHSGGRR